jgi:malonate transporter MadL subunit
MYIPIVVAMAAQQNVRAALSGGPMVVLAGVGRGGDLLRAGGLLGRLARHD